VIDTIDNTISQAEIINLHHMWWFSVT